MTTEYNTARSNHPKHNANLVPQVQGSASSKSVQGASTSSKKRRNNNGHSFLNPILRKAPQAPRRFKSSYILFFMAKQDEIKQVLPKGSSVGDVSKRSSQLWKALSAEERAYWDERAEQDKQRYIREKDEYTGPWQVPYKRAKKNPLAPKRPMSSFLFFSKERRKAIKDMHPNMKNTEISSILGQQWRNATEEERRPHIEMEQQERLKYKVAVEKFNREEAERKKREAEELAEAKLMASTKNTKRSPSLSPPPPIAVNANTEPVNNAPSNYLPMGGQMSQQPHHHAPYSANLVQLNINSNGNNSGRSPSSNIAVASAMHYEQQLQQNYQQHYPSSTQYMARSHYNPIQVPPSPRSDDQNFDMYHSHLNFDQQDQQLSPINVNVRQPSPSIGLDATFENPFSFDNEHDSFNTALQ